MRILIDTNIYLGLFISTRLRELLPALEEAAEHVFVSRQIAREVERNKVKVAAQFLTDQTQHTRALALGFLDLGLPTAAEVENKANAYLATVAAGKDVVSRSLARLFKHAVDPTPPQHERARQRRERGDSPGKSEDALGDQLTWEMWVDHVQAFDRVWIITADQDYYSRLGGNRYLNALLQGDLDRAHGEPVRAHVFDRLSEGLADYRRSMGDVLPSLPPQEAIGELSREERHLRQQRGSSRCPQCGA